MGSARLRKSTGRKAGASVACKGKSPKSRLHRPPVDLDAILGRLSDAMSIIATASSALAHAQQGPGIVNAHDVGEEITTLEHGVRALRCAYDEMDVALRAVRP